MRKHGRSKTRAYNIWHTMLRRCSPGHDAYKWYGARGIAVCERWHVFENFHADMGEPPDGMTLDRFPNQNGDYAPGNCRWATHSEQMRNRANNRLLTAGGRTACLVEWLEDSIVSRGVVSRRLKRGWPIDKAISTPGKSSRWAKPSANAVDEILQGVRRAPAKNWSRRWTEEQVIEIRRRYAEGQTIRGIAAATNIPYPTIRSITAGKSWRHLPFDEARAQENAARHEEGAPP